MITQRKGQWGGAAALVLMVWSAVATTQEVGAAGEQLAPVYSGIPHDAVYDINISGQSGVAVGAFGVILESKDSGASWVKADSGTEYALLGVAVNGDKRIIVGQRGTVLLGKPEGGWEKIDSKSESRLMQVSVNTAGLAIAVGEFGSVLRSRDAGRTWEKLTLDWAGFREDGYEPHLYAVHVDDNNRVVVGGEFAYVIVSTDSGDTWNLATKGEKSIFGMHLRPDG
ncbi:MAG: WD40/YVTN/BNR-like repeat-containing protein, partial [Gammaproteobacteria bacterium]